MRHRLKKLIHHSFKAMKKKVATIKNSSRKSTVLGMSVFMLAFAGVGGLIIVRSQAATGDCSTSNVIGEASSTVSVPETAQYNVWARMKVPDTTNSNNLNGVRIELSGASSQCFTHTTTDNNAVSGWQWISSDAEYPSTKHITEIMDTGEYNIKLLGLREGVVVDRILLSKASEDCTPSNSISGSVMPGDNCIVPLPGVTVSSDPATIDYGDSTTITWSSTNATSCTASDGSSGWAGLKATSGTFDTGNLTSSQTYSIQCTGTGGSGSLQITSVTVNAAVAPTVSLEVDPTEVSSGGSTTITWSSTNATSCTASDGSVGWSGDKAVSGSQGSGSLTATSTYNLSCTGPGGSIDATPVTVTVNTDPPDDDVTEPSVTMDIPGVELPSGESEVVVGDRSSVVWQPFATDNVGILSLAVYVNNQQISLTDGAYTFGSQSNGNGDYVLRAVATDTNGNVTESSVTIKLRHPDFNRDNVINSSDFNGLLRTWGATSTNYDLNDSGSVNSSDFNILLRNWGSSP